MTNELREPCAVPLVERLERVPADAILRWTDEDGLQASHSVPVGKLAHEAAKALTRSSLISDEMVEVAAEAVHDFLDECFPEGAMPGGRQLFAVDELDADFKHEAGCEALARAVLTALSSSGGK